MHHYCDMGFWGMHAFWWFFWIVFIVGVLSFFGQVSKSKAKDHKESSLEILQKRYAKGEISTTEYEERKSTLNSDINIKKE
jgi:putative membrane protein